MRVLTGLVGSGIGASGSPAIHEQEARALGFSLHYQLVDLETNGRRAEQLPQLLDAAQALGFAGVNVTHPCKQAVIPLLDELSTDAETIGAVNTVVFRGGRKIGYNTDGQGFAESLRLGLAGASLESVLVIGAGGAGCAVCYAALRYGVKHLFVNDVNQGRAKRLVERFAGGFPEASIVYAPEPAAAIARVNGVIHATPVGMIGHPGMAIPAELLSPRHWVADVVYFPLETELLRAARSKGCRTLDGGGMAVLQAAEAFRLFTGVEPDRERMLARFRESIRG